MTPRICGVPFLAHADIIRYKGTKKISYLQIFREKKIYFNNFSYFLLKKKE